MKVVCINNKFSRDFGLIFNLTFGKVYDVTDIGLDGCYDVINDYGKTNVFEKNRFESLSKVRNEKINKLLEI